MLAALLWNMGLKDPRHHGWWTSLNPVTPAHAQRAKWDDVGDWEIYGGTNDKVCIAITHYVAGDTYLSIGVGHNDVSLMIDSPRVVGAVGSHREHNVMVSSGEMGSFSGIITDEGTISFRDLPKDTIMLMARADSIIIQGLGHFSLADSAGAMRSTMECFIAQNST